MPAERTQFNYKDISASFDVNPVNMDLIALKNANAVARSLRNLILTNKGERPFNPELGSNVNAYLFESANNVTAAVIEESIRNTIINFEERVDLLDVIVETNEDFTAYNVTINYELEGVDAPEQELSFALQSNR